MNAEQNLAPHIKIKPALCLDWDGTIRRSKSGATFIKDQADIEIMPGIEKAIWAYRKMGYLIVGISNQGGVAFGFKTPSQINLERDATLSLFQNNPFHIVKMCYHMEGGKVHPYKYRSMLRKPNIGMLAVAEMDAWNDGFVMIDWDKSLFVGDRPEDEECAKNANISFKHVDTFLSEPHVFEIQ